MTKKYHRSPTNRQTSLKLFYFFAVSILIFLAYSSWAYDDPFITYRYAENLAKGVGFVYNPGEQILSTTTPLFTLILAGFQPLWQNLPHLANLIGALSLAAGGLLIWDLVRSWGYPLAGWAGLLLYPTFPLLASTLGSEIPIYLALTLATFASYARRRYTLTALFAVLTVLTRPDGILVAGLIAGHFAMRVKKPVPWQAVAVFLLPLAAWALFASTYFGSPIPVTLATKQAQFSLEQSSGFLSGLLLLAWNYLSLPHYLIAGILALLGAILIFRRSLAWGLLIIWIGLYIISFSALQVSSFFWYYAPLVPGVVCLIGIGLSGLDERTAQFRRPWSVLATAVLLTITGFQIQDLNNLRQQPDRRFPIYQAVGQWLAAHTAPSAAVATLEVGIIGYYTPNPILDFAGLIQPRVAEQFGLGTTYEDAALWAVENYSFEYLILHDGLMPRLEADYVEARCSSIQRFPGEQSNYEFDMVIYACTN